MNYKLIKETGHIIHDFRTGAWMGHAVEISPSSEKKVLFKNIETYSLTGQIFDFIPVEKGDLVFRIMNSGKVGVFEVTEAKQNRLKELTSFGPKDLYDVTIVFCGYYIEKGNIISIFTGYGIKKPLFSFNWTE